MVPDGSHDLNGKGSGAAAAVGWGGWSWGAGPSPLSGMVLQHLSQRQGKVWLVGSEVGDDAGEEGELPGGGGDDLGREGVRSVRSPLKMSAAVVLAVFFLLLLFWLCQGLHGQQYLPPLVQSLRLLRTAPGLASRQHRQHITSLIAHILQLLV